jgi:outer membrane lipoprotein SlyB
MTSLSRDEKRGLFWEGGRYAGAQAKKGHSGEASTRVTRSQALGTLGGLAGGGVAGGAAGLAGGKAKAVTIPLGAYGGAMAGGLAGGIHGGKKTYKRLKSEGKIKKDYTVSAFGVDHGY